MPQLSKYRPKMDSGGKILVQIAANSKGFVSGNSDDKRFFLRIINCIMLFLVAYLVPTPSKFGIYDGLYGFKDNLLCFFSRKKKNRKLCTVNQFQTDRY